MSHGGPDRCPVCVPGSIASMHEPATEAFVAHRSLLFTVAYEMLGFGMADAREGLQSHVDKRDPQFPSARPTE